MTDAPRHPDRFDAFALVASRGRIEGTVDPFDLERVQDALVDENGEIPPAQVKYVLEGDVDGMGRSMLNVSLDGEVPLQCQRCLRLFTFPVHQRTSVLLAHDEQELAYLDENDEREVLLADAPLDPQEVVEDELVLSLPYVPRCDRPDCVTEVEVQDQPEAASPFAALGALKREARRE